MSRWIAAVAIGGLLAVIAVTVAGGVHGGERTPSSRADALARELRCPDCQGLSVADSPTGSAQAIRDQIDELVAGGASDEAVRSHFVARYGEWILLAPRGLAYWLLPMAAVFVAATALAVWLARRRPPVPPPTAPLSTDERRRLHEEAEALDA